MNAAPNRLPEWLAPNPMLERTPICAAAVSGRLVGAAQLDR